MRQEKSNEPLEKTTNRFASISSNLLYSKAYRDMQYGPASKCLNWFYAKRSWITHKRKRGHKRVEYLKGPISFTYDEARDRGLSANRFSKALKELYKYGFIDVEHHGSGLQGDYSKYTISERWKDYGTYQFKNEEFPQSSPHGFRQKQKKLPKLIVRRRDRKQMKESLIRKIERSYLSRHEE